jgi:hypothetical protein
MARHLAPTRVDLDHSCPGVSFEICAQMAGGFMPRAMVGLLTAASAAASVIVGDAQGMTLGILIAGIAVAAGLASYATAPSKKTILQCLIIRVRNQYRATMFHGGPDA